MNAAVRSSGGIFGDLLARVGDVGRSLALLAEDSRPQTPEAAVDLAADLLAGRGEATGLALAQAVLDRFEALDTAGRQSFFRLITNRFGVERGALSSAIERWQREGDDAAARALHYACEPRSQELLRMLNRTRGGTAALVAMRTDLLACLRQSPELRGLDADFRHLFSSWFNRGFLELRRIDWSTSAAVLEKIIAYEAVHAIQDWDDLRRRVAAPDRQLFGFFHPALPDEPLIFVEIALTDAVPGAISPILARDRTPLDPDRATTAVFYSISNCQTGLRGISFGNFLIKQVVEVLRQELPAVRTFVTLSPVPGLRAWAQSQLAANDSEFGPTARGVIQRLDAVDGSIDGVEAIEAVDALPEIAARYLAEAKRPDGLPLDPVARFHLGNGARLERIHTQADHSARGLTGAYGVMVNYLYDLDEIEKNHEAYANDGRVMASASVRRLLRSRAEGKR
ncbi:MAG: malonyl-CoA decarboxylase [Pseudomonadota bacterium]